MGRNENDHEMYTELLGAFRKDDQSKPVAYEDFVKARAKKKRKKENADEKCFGCRQSLGGKIMDTKTRDLYTRIAFARKFVVAAILKKIKAFD